MSFCSRPISASRARMAERVPLNTTSMFTTRRATTRVGQCMPWKNETTGSLPGQSLGKNLSHNKKIAEMTFSHKDRGFHHTSTKKDLVCFIFPASSQSFFRPEGLEGG